MARVPFVISLLVSVWMTSEAYARCGAAVSASVSAADATVTITATATGRDCAPTPRTEIYGSWDGGSESRWGVCEAPACTIEVVHSIACWTPGAHRVDIKTSCNGQEPNGACNADPENGTATATFVVPPADPSVSAEGELDASGTLTVRVPYDFPNTNNPGQRRIHLFLDDALIRRTDVTGGGLEQRSGVWEPAPIDASCLPTGEHRLKAIAVACGREGDPDSTAEQETTFEVDSTPHVGLSYSEDDDLLRMPYSFPNTRSWGQRRIDLYVNGALHASTADARTNPHPLEERDGVWEVPYDATCAEPGTEIVAIARACGADSGEGPFTDRAELTLDVDPKPDVSLSESKDANGNDVLTIDYSFPFTTSPSQRHLALFVDGAFHAAFSPDQISGSLPPVILGTGCWETARVVAVACGRPEDERFTDEAEIESRTQKPTLSVTLRKSLNPENGRFEAVVVYDLRHAIAGRFVRVEHLSWTDADGTEHPASGVLWQITDPEQLSGMQIVPFDADSGARHVRILVTAHSCGTVTRTPGIDCDCASHAPVYFADGNVRLTDTDPLPQVAGQTLVRTYDSDEQVVGLFGRGVMTFLGMRLMRDQMEAHEVVSVVTEANDLITFQRTGNDFIQTWPGSQRALGTLTLEGNAEYIYRPAGGTRATIFRVSDGKVVALRDLGTGREARIVYAGGVPATVTDSWTNGTWTLTVANGRVTSIATAALSWTYEYDANGNLIRVLAPGGAPWRTYEYAANRMAVSRDALGNVIESHTYDAVGYAISSEGLGDEIANMEYNLPAATPGDVITRVTTKSGAQTEYVLRPSGGSDRVAEIRGGCASCGGERGDRTFVRDAEGRVVREQGADGYVTVSTYSGRHLVMQERHLKPAGCEPRTDADQCRMTTDQLAAATLASTPATLKTRFTYADPTWPERATAVLTTSLEATPSAPDLVRTETFSYHPLTGAVLTHEIRAAPTEPGAPGRSRATATTLYEAGLAPAFDPGGSFQQWLSFPQPALLTKSVDGPRTDVADITSFVYYPIDPSVPARLRGRLAATRNAAGHITRYDDYDVFGNITRMIDANGIVTEQSFDVLGRMKTSTLKGLQGCSASADPLCATDLTTTRSYSPATGPLHTEQRPGGGVTAYAYDARGRVQSISRGPAASSLAERIEYGYDPLTGKKAWERFLAKDAGEWVETSRQSFTYTEWGELEKVTNADGTFTAYTYDEAGRIRTVQDERHAAPNTEYLYDAGGRLETVRQKLPQAPGGWISTRYGYDIHGNLTKVTDPNGNVTSYRFDDHGTMLRQVSPVTGTTTYRYDDGGDLVETIDANGASTVRAYDALGRVTSSISTRGTAQETVSWTYDSQGLGRLGSMTDPAGTTGYTYDRRGLVLRENRSSGELATSMQYGYDADGNRNRVGDVTYTHDYAGRPLSADAPEGPVVTAAAYLPFGPVTSLAIGNGTMQTFTYDARYRPLTRSLHEGGTPLVSHTYEYDAKGNILAIDDALDPAFDRVFGYDDLDRLTTASTGAGLWGAGSYSYDAMGNMLTSTLGSQTQTFAYVGTTPKLSTVPYDAAGNEGATAYTPRNLRGGFGYDGRGVRVRSDYEDRSSTPFADVTRLFDYTPELRLAQLTEYRPDTTTTTTFVWFGTLPILERRIGPDPHEIGLEDPYPPVTRRFTFADHLGTPIAQTDATAALIWRAEYEPYGSIHAMRTGTVYDQLLRLPGQDEASSGGMDGTYYNIFRWYRAGWGRYTQADPAEFEGGFNLYAYALANPLLRTDLDGLTSYKGFPADKEKEFRDAVEKAKEALKKNCCDDAKDVLNRLERAEFVYVDEDKDWCGYVSPNDWRKHRIKISRTAFDPNNPCFGCPLPSIVVHESVHLRRRGMGEGSAYKRQRQCFGCPPEGPGHPK